MAARGLDRVSLPRATVAVRSRAALSRAARVASCALLWASVQPASAQRADFESVRRQALYSYYHGITAELAHERIGVEGVPALLRLLADPAFARRDNVVAFLTYLGAGESTTALLEVLASPPAPVTVPEEDRALLLLPQALVTSRRGASRARSRRCWR